MASDLSVELTTMTKQIEADIEIEPMSLMHYSLCARRHPRVVYNCSMKPLGLLHTSQMMQIAKQQKLFSFPLAKYIILTATLMADYSLPRCHVESPT